MTIILNNDFITIGSFITLCLIILALLAMLRIHYNKKIKKDHIYYPRCPIYS